MLISLINRSTTLDDEAIQPVVRAINRQIEEDFAPYWSFGGRLRLEGAVGKRIRSERPADMRGDAVLYLIDKAKGSDAEGWHDRSFGDIPFGFVFLDVCEAIGDSWSATLSHEALELIGDPMNNLLVQGPHPHDRRRMVFHMFEMCDAVQAEMYEIDRVQVSNFVLPAYFTTGNNAQARTDFLGRKHDGKVLAPFGVNPGGYINFYDPHGKGRRWESYEPPADAASARRRKIKSRAQAGRGYRRVHAKTAQR